MWHSNILEQTINLTWSQITVIAGVLIAIGGNYWLLIHLGNEGSKIKETVESMGKEHEKTKTQVENHKDVIAEQRSDIKEIKQDIKTLLQRK